MHLLYKMKNTLTVLMLALFLSVSYATSNSALSTLWQGIATTTTTASGSVSWSITDPEIDDSLVNALEKQPETDLVKELKDAKDSLKLQSVNTCDGFDTVLTNWINKNKTFFMQGGWYGRPIPLMMQWWMEGDMVKTTVSNDAKVESATAPGVGGGAWVDHSATNVQKAGIDEPDIIKNDGKYIYYVNNTKKLLYILKWPYNGSTLDLSTVNTVSILRLPKTYNATDLLLDGNKLVLVSSRYLNLSYDYNKSFFDKNTRTNIVVFDMTNREKLSIVRLFDFPGQIQESRLSNGKLTVVSNLWFSRWPIYWIMNEKKGIDDIVTTTNIIPSGAEVVRKSSGILDKHAYKPDCASLQYILPDKPENFNPSVGVVHTIDLNKDTNATTNLFYGNAGQIHLTDKSLYVVSSISLWGYQYSTCPPNARCAMPLIRREPNNFSLIHKYGLTTGKPVYQNSALAKGDLLTQYSMDEDANGNFRILTRTWSPELSTHLWVFDNKLNLSNWLLNIEPKEEFKASRFIWDKLYLVTFQQIDPLFVIDLVGKPKILGELKIPGYSQYLHPYTAMKDGKQLLIGLGTDTQETGWRVTTNGVKLDLYEVNFNAINNNAISIKQLFTKTLGWRGSWSEATENPRVFVWNEKTKQLFLPIIMQNEVEKKICNKDYYGQDYCYPQYTYNTTFAWVKTLSISLSAGITEVSSKDYKDQIIAYLKTNNQYYGSDYNNFGLDQWQYMSLGNRAGYIGEVTYFINNAFADFNSTKEWKLIKF